MASSWTMLRRWEAVLVLFVVLECMLFSILSPGFMRLDNLLYSMNDFAFIVLAAIPLTFVIITGGIDVSVGSVMGLTSIVVGVLWMNGMSVWLALIVGLLVAVIAGGVNGSLVAFTTVQPLVVTLGTMFLFSGIALVISGGSSASGYEGISGFPASFVELANGKVLAVPNPIWLIVISVIIFGILLHYTRYGRNVFLVGININAAAFSGIKTKWTVMSTYMLSGLGGGIGGIVLTSYFSSARSDLGAEAVLPVITAVVLGGTSIFGGRGSVLGTAIACVFIGLMQYGLQMSGLSSPHISVVIGSILILAVILKYAKWHAILGLFYKGDMTDEKS